MLLIVVLIVVLMGDVRRFIELHSMVGGVSEKMLSQTLKRLEAHGLVHSQSYETVSPHTEYSLTPLGRNVGAMVSREARPTALGRCMSPAQPLPIAMRLIPVVQTFKASPRTRARTSRSLNRRSVNLNVMITTSVVRTRRVAHGQS